MMSLGIYFKLFEVIFPVFLLLELATGLGKKIQSSIAISLQHLQVKLVFLHFYFIL